MRWSSEELAAAVGGRIVHEPQGPGTAAGGGAVDGVTIDSRQTSPGSLFVPIRGARDGHDFIADAVARGAGGYLVEAGWVAGGSGLPAPGVVAIEVHDATESLGALGRSARGRLGGPVVGITGSVGKTSTKDLAAAALRTSRWVAASPLSFNNELGVPLTLANAPEDAEVAVVEMGARHPGNIAYLCEVAAPTIGVVTRVATAHTEMFGDIESVAAAKAELVEALPADGTAVLNADDDLVAAMASRSAAPVLRYSAMADSSADLVAEGVEVDGMLRPKFTLRSPWGVATVVVGAGGRQQVGNALAALAVASLCGVPLDAAVAGLRDPVLSPWRMEVLRSPSGALVVNDSYNANPSSMTAALRSIAELASPRKLAFLGEMAELGDRSAAEHAAVVKLAAELGIRIVAVATDAYGLEPAADAERALAAAGPLGPGDAVLVKGSRVAGLEALAERLLASR